MNPDKPIYTFLGHHKAATTWMLGVINSICSQTGIEHKHFHNEKMFDFDLLNTIKQHKINFFSYTNANIDYIKPIINEIRGFHLIRDPRDVVVSAYFSHLYSHSTEFWPELEDHRKELQSLSKDEGLMLTIKEIDSLKVDGINLNAIHSIDKWNYSCPNILEIKFEDLIVNPYSIILDVFDFIEIVDESTRVLDFSTRSIIKLIIKRFVAALNPSSLVRSRDNKISPFTILNIVYMNDFKHLTKGRKTGEEDVKHHFRKGKSGDWKNHFNEAHKTYFKQKYPKLLVKLGYEENDNW